MPNGRPGDHLMTDVLVHGRHPFALHIGFLLRQIWDIDPDFPDGMRAARGQWEPLDAIEDCALGHAVGDREAMLQTILTDLKDSHRLEE